MFRPSCNIDDKRICHTSASLILLQLFEYDDIDVAVAFRLSFLLKLQFKTLV